MPNIVESVKGFDHLNTDVTLDDLQIFYPVQENAKITKLTKGSILFIILSVTMCLAVVFSTLFVWKNKQDQIQLKTLNNSENEESSRRVQPQLNSQSTA